MSDNQFPSDLQAIVKLAYMRGLLAGAKNAKKINKQRSEIRLKTLLESLFKKSDAAQ